MLLDIGDEPAKAVSFYFSEKHVSGRIRFNHHRFYGGKSMVINLCIISHFHLLVHLRAIMEVSKKRQPRKSFLF